MKPRSAKNKGKLWQNRVRSYLLEVFPDLEEDDIHSTTMGDQGEDLQLSPKARKVLHNTSWECKSGKSKTIWDTMRQAKANAGKYRPVGAMKKGRQELVVMELKDFLEIISK